MFYLSTSIMHTVLSLHSPISSMIAFLTCLSLIFRHSSICLPNSASHFFTSSYISMFFLTLVWFCTSCMAMNISWFINYIYAFAYTSGEGFSTKVSSKAT